MSNTSQPNGLFSTLQRRIRLTLIGPRRLSATERQAIRRGIVDDPEVDRMVTAFAEHDGRVHTPAVTAQRTRCR